VSEKPSPATFARHRRMMHWSKLYADQWRQVRNSGISLNAKLTWVDLQSILSQSEQPGYLIENGEPITMKSLALRTGRKPQIVEREIEELIEIGILFRNENSIVGETRMVLDIDATSYEVGRKTRRESAGNSDSFPSISRDIKNKSKKQEPEQDAAVAAEQDAESDRGSIISSIVSRFENQNDPEFIESLKSCPEFAGIDISKEKKNHDSYRLRQNLTSGTRKTLVSWLLNCDKPLQAAKPSPVTRDSDPMGETPSEEKRVSPEQWRQLKEELRGCVKPMPPASEVELNGADGS
jgi:hypothetical protein